MKKYVFLSVLAIAGCLSCGKDAAKPQVDPSDAVSLAKSVKVYYSERITGKVPAYTYSGLYLNDNQSDVIAISGRYVIIDPQVSANEVGGYMVQVEGDTTGYFKVDYSRTRNARLVVGESAPYKTQDASYRDSVVMIKLPEGIKSGNFTLNLTAYGNDGSVSNTVTYNVQLIQPAGLSTLNGSWKKTGISDGVEWNKDIYRGDSAYSTVYCVNNTPTTNCPNGQFCDGQRMLLYVYKLETDELVLSSNGTFTRTESYKYAPVDWAASACGALAYKNSNTTRQETGGWSYDATTKSLYTIIDNNGGPGLETFTYRKNEVLETKGNQFILKDEYNTFEYTKK